MTSSASGRVGRWLRWPLAAALLLAASLVPSTGAAVTKVACVGASTTSGDGSTAGHHFPDELGRALGAAFQVRNFGVSGTTVLRKGDNPYWPHMPAPLAYMPDIGVFWFGGNDAKPQNWTTHKDEFVGDYEDMLHMFQSLPTHPRVFIFRSMVIHDVEGIPKAVLEMQVFPKIDQIATDTGAIVINYHDAFITHPEYFPDGVHPNDAGTVAIGKFVAGVITAALAAPPDAGAADTGAAEVSEKPAPDAAPTPVADAAADSVTAPEATPPPSGSGGAAGGTGGATMPPAPGVTQSASSGCAMSLASVRGNSAWLILAVAMVFAATRRRR